MTQEEIVTIGVSEIGNDHLNALIEAGVFAEKMDGFRFAAALALAQGVVPEEIVKRSPFLNRGSLDPEQTLRKAVEALLPEQLENTTPYRLIERLADWGVRELYAQLKNGEIDFAGILSQVADKAVE